MAACEISPRGAEAGPNCPEYVFMIYSYMAVASLLLDGKDHSFRFIYLVCGFLTW